MRKLSTPALSFFRWRSFVLNTDRVVQRAPPVVIPHKSLPSRHLAQVRTEPLSEVWFTSSSPKRSPADDLLGSPGNGGDHKPPDERILRLGKSEWSFGAGVPVLAIVTSSLQHYRLSRPCSRTFSPRHYRTRSFLLLSLCTYSHRLTHTCLPSKEEFPTEPRFGQPPSRGAACP